ncbi:glycine cleavage system protein GcvH [Paenibacillus sp. J2TS4]|uniref:glycine cleavage system protein GcvH n=1 Tax=Paenibacillus sp. J2TS4 TaxID=2807194 RepID=UPI001B1F7F67|nr:glycine cleavage system protein GcvH [Paenibacillus sp. J2TS4]GIP32185.1 glycine cleavage system H protein [Paenibacillus sp. J2TS4]
MSELKSGLLYSKEHEWVQKLDGNKVRIGITDFAQNQLGDIVFVELPAEGDEITAGDSTGSVESVKTVSDIYSPVTGKVVSVNQTLDDSPELVNTDPYGQGWMFEVELESEEALAGLLSEEDYRSFTDSE